MPELTAADYAQAARLRLEKAAAACRQSAEQPYAAAYLELADAATLVWGAGIDLISALMLTAGESGLGTSTTRRRFLKAYLSAQFPLLRNPLNTIGWTYLVRLHNFQHNLDMTEAQFRDACEYSQLFFITLNIELPPALRLPPAAFTWLASVR